MGFLDRLKAGLAKTAKVLSTDVRDLFKREGRLVDDEFLAELRAALVKTDMGPAAAEAIVADVGTRLRTRVVEPKAVIMQCGSGVTACHNLLALEVAGMPGAALYPGSWSEWSADPARPVSTGA